MADIVIRGMEMPKEGNWKTIRIYPDGTCAVPNWQGDCTFLPCIAIPLPKGHGRLIDADAFLATIRPLCTEDTQAACTLETVKQLMVKHISSAPTIVPAEGGGKNG